MYIGIFYDFFVKQSLTKILTIMKYSVIKLSVFLLVVLLDSFCAIALPMMNNEKDHNKANIDKVQSCILSFANQNAALEIEDIYDIRVLAYQIQNNPNMSVEVAVRNNAEAYPRLLSVLRSLQSNGISYRDITIKVIDTEDDLTKDEIRLNLLERPSLDYAMASIN